LTGFDADEKGQSRQAQHQIPIAPVLGGAFTLFMNDESQSASHKKNCFDPGENSAESP
jgi:hypothetical protein